MSLRRRSYAAPKGCRRLIGETLPEDLLAVDYGHYSLKGSIFAVRTILAPVIDAELARSGKELTPMAPARGLSLAAAGTEWGRPARGATGSRRVRRIAALTSALTSRIDRIILEMQQAEAVAGLAASGAPIVKGEELEIGHADRLFDPQSRRNLHGVAERHRRGFPSAVVAVAGHLPFGVAKPRDAQHRVRVGRHQRRQRPDDSGSIRTGWRIVRERRSTAELRKKDAADPDATLRDRRLGQNRLDVMLRLARVSIGVAKHDT